MRKILITAVICLSAGLVAGWFLFHLGGEQKGKRSERKILYYRNPMNPQMTSKAPKKAPDGMDYVPVYADEAEASGRGEKKIAYYRDPMHPWYTSSKPGKAPDCGMDLVPVYEGDEDVRGIRVDPNTVQNIGVTVEGITRRKLTKTIRTSGIVEFDETGLYNINTKFMGWIEKLYVDSTGTFVHKGEPLLDIYSPELVSTQEEYLQAVRYRQKMQRSPLDEARQAADELVQSARRRLEYWDISEKQIAALEQQNAPKRALTIFAPADGIVTEKMITDGQQVMAGMTLYKIANLSTVWVTADIYQYELDWVRIGEKVDLEVSYLPEKPLQGTVSYIYPYLSAETRTARIRIEVHNTPDFALKPGMFATVKIVSPVAVDAVAVPEQAIIRSGTRNIAVIALGGGYFDPREIRLGVSADSYVQVLEGVHEGEKVVTSAQFLIDSESNLKAAISLMGAPAKPDSPMPTQEEPEAPSHTDHQTHDMQKENIHEGHNM